MLLSRDAQGQPIAIRREDYSAPAYWIDTVELTFDLVGVADRTVEQRCHRDGCGGDAQRRWHDQIHDLLLSGWRWGGRRSR